MGKVPERPQREPYRGVRVWISTITIGITTVLSLLLASYLVFVTWALLEGTWDWLLG